MDFSTSKAVVIEKPRQVSVRNVKLTPLRPESIVTKTIMSAISTGTDMKTWRGIQAPEKLYYPCVPGYEGVGEVVYTGSESKGFKVGDRVVINECRSYGDICAAWGGSTEYTVKDSVTACGAADTPAHIPANLSYKDAVISHLAAVALKGVERIKLEPGFNVVVTGSGMIGSSAMQIVRNLCPKAKIICIEKNEFRRSIAKNFADHVIPVDGYEEKHLADLTNGKKADVLIECTGDTKMVFDLYRFIKDGGWVDEAPPAHIHLQGDYPENISLDIYNRWFTKNCTITMTCARKPGGEEIILDWMSKGTFNTSHLPVEIWPVGKAPEAYEYLEKKREEVFKILLDWQQA